MVKPQKKITREILVSQLESRLYTKLKDEADSLIREELGDIMQEYRLADKNALSKLLGKDGLKIRVKLDTLEWTLNSGEK